VTDANVMVVGKVWKPQHHFPKVFGPQARIPECGSGATFDELEQTGRSAEEVAEGFINIAVQQTHNAIKRFSCAATM
jgi:5-oxoprolinase (ATP-hydrolysing)